MAITAVTIPFEVFLDLNGEPLENGYIYVGLADSDAEEYPAQVYWDSALTVPAAQPVRTIAGLPQNNGTAAVFYVDGDYSITVRDKDQTLVYSVQSASASVGISGLDTVYQTPALLLASTETIRGVGETWKAGKITYTEAASGATDHDVTTAGGVKLYVSSENLEVPPRAFFAPSDGTDGAVELQAWLDWLGENPQTTGLVDARYSTASDLYIKKPVNIKTAVWGDIRSATGSTPLTPPCSIVALAGVTDLITVKAETAGDIISGVRLEVYLEGANTAERGVVVSSADWCFFDLFVERCTRFGCDVNDANGKKSAFLHFQRYFYSAGVNALCNLSTGIRMGSVDGANGASTNFWLGEVWTGVQEVEITGVADLSPDARFTTTPDDHNFSVGDEVWIYSMAKVSDDSPVYEYQCDRGTIATVPNSTQFTVTGNAGTVIAHDANATGYVSGGVGVWVQDIDSTLITKSHGAPIYFGRDDRGETPMIREGRKNVITHSNGKILLGDGSLNCCQYMNSENSAISVLTNSAGTRGDGTLSGAIQDRNTGQVWRLGEYRSQDSHFLEATAAYVSDSATQSAVAGLLLPCVDFAATGTSTANWGFRLPRDWADGILTSITVYYSGANDAASGTFDLTVNLENQPELGGQGSWDETVTGSIDSPINTNDMTKHKFVFQRPVAEGDFINIQIQRDGADSSTEIFKMVGIEVKYDATGPSDNKWQWPDWYTA